MTHKTFEEACAEPEQEISGMNLDQLITHHIQQMKRLEETGLSAEERDRTIIAMYVSERKIAVMPLAGGQDLVVKLHYLAFMQKRIFEEIPVNLHWMHFYVADMKTAIENLIDHVQGKAN